MRLDETKCAHQTMSLFGEVTKAPSQPAKTSSQAEIYFDGGCLGNPGQKYGSFLWLLPSQTGWQGNH